MSMRAKLTAVLIAVLTLIGSHWYAYRAGDRNGTNATLVQTQAEENARQANVIAALDAANAQAQARVQQLARDAEKASRDYETEKRAIRAAAERAAGQRVRINAAAFCHPAAGAAESAAPGSNEQAGTGAAFLPESFANDLRRLAADADEVTADLRHLVRRVDEAGCFE